MILYAIEWLFTGLLCLGALLFVRSIWRSVVEAKKEDK